MFHIVFIYTHTHGAHVECDSFLLAIANAHSAHFVTKYACAHTALQHAPRGMLDEEAHASQTYTRSTWSMLVQQHMLVFLGDYVRSLFAFGFTQPFLSRDLPRWLTVLTDAFDAIAALIHRSSNTHAHTQTNKSSQLLRQQHGFSGLNTQHVRDAQSKVMC